VDVLHRFEAAALGDALGSSRPSVIAAAASTIEDAVSRRALSGPGVHVVWLRGSPAVLAKRARSGSHRPSGPLAELSAQVERRHPLFEQVADATVDVDDRTPAEVLEAAIAALPSNGG
jgi:shikimate kinase